MVKSRAAVSDDSAPCFSVIVFRDLYPTFARGFFSLCGACSAKQVWLLPHAFTCWLEYCSPHQGPSCSLSLASSSSIAGVYYTGGPPGDRAKNYQSFSQFVSFFLIFVKRIVRCIFTKLRHDAAPVQNERDEKPYCETHQDRDSGLVMIYGLRTSILGGAA